MARDSTKPPGAGQREILCCVVLKSDGTVVAWGNNDFYQPTKVTNMKLDRRRW